MKLCPPVTQPKLLQNLSQYENVCLVALKRLCKQDFLKSIGWAGLRLPLREHRKIFYRFWSVEPGCAYLSSCTKQHVMTPILTCYQYNHHQVLGLWFSSWLMKWLANTIASLSSFAVSNIWETLKCALFREMYSLRSVTLTILLRQSNFGERSLCAAKVLNLRQGDREYVYFWSMASVNHVGNDTFFEC